MGPKCIKNSLRCSGSKNSLVLGTITLLIWTWFQYTGLAPLSRRCQPIVFALGFDKRLGRNMQHRACRFFCRLHHCRRRRSLCPVCGSHRCMARQVLTVATSGLAALRAFARRPNDIWGGREGGGGARLRRRR